MRASWMLGLGLFLGMVATAEGLAAENKCSELLLRQNTPAAAGQPAEAPAPATAVAAPGDWSQAPEVSWWNRYLVDPIFRMSARGLTRLRYRVRVHGLNRIDPTGGGILVLPNHPAAMDPVLQYLELSKIMTVRPVIYEDHAKEGFGRWIAARTGALIVPSESRGNDERKAQVDRLVDAVVAGLERGENFLLYPEGMLTRGLPAINGKAMVELILKKRPTTRVVLSQMSGMDGSSFSAQLTGDFPDMARVLPQRIVDLLMNGVLWMPKRDITIRYREPADFPRHGTRTQINDYLERFHREGLAPSRRVPYRWSEPRTPVALPYPVMPQVTVTGDLRDVPADVRARVLAQLAEMAHLDDPSSIKDDDELGRDLGIDSLRTLDFTLWLEKEFNVRSSAPVVRVREALLIAAGKMAASGVKVAPPDGRWIRDTGEGKPARLPDSVRDPIAALFWQFRHNPDKVVFVDDRFGAVTYRDFAMMLKLFVPRVAALPGDAVGVMLPSSVGDVVATYAVWLAGKRAVFVNFTAEEAAVRHVLDSEGVSSVLTSEQFVKRLKDVRGVEFPGLASRYVTLESLRAGIPRREQLGALLWKEQSGFWRDLPRPAVGPETVSAILATSGSSGMPKSVPYTFGLEMTSLADIVAMFRITDRDRVIHVAPPFHALGHRLKVVAATLGVPTVFHPDPGQGAVIAQIIEMYRPTVVVGTPKILTGVALSSRPGQLEPLRLMVSGAAKLTRDNVDVLVRAAPRLGRFDETGTIVEGYGLTETGPVALVNPVWGSRLGTLGTAVPSVDAIVVSPGLLEDRSRWGELRDLPVGEKGILLVAAKDPSRSPIMRGYRNYSKPQPFVELGGRQWFVTGDLVHRLPEAPEYFVYVGREDNEVKRFGEKVSLERLEELLSSHALFASREGDQGPVVAVIPTPVESDPDFVLYTTRDVTVAEANRALREAGAPQVADIREVIRLERLPVLGSEKLDRKALKRDLQTRFSAGSLR